MAVDMGTIGNVGSLGLKIVELLSLDVFLGGNDAEKIGVLNHRLPFNTLCWILLARSKYTIESY